MAIWCNCFISFLISFLGIMSFYKSLIDCLWIAPLRPVVMVMRRLTCQLVVISVCMSGLYLAVFVVVVCGV